MKKSLVVTVLVLAVLTLAATDGNKGDAGNGFVYRNVSFKPFTYPDGKEAVVVSAIVQNKSGREWETVFFEAFLYDKKGNLITKDWMTISNFKRNTNRRLAGNIKAPARKIHSYRIEYMPTKTIGTITWEQRRVR